MHEIEPEAAPWQVLTLKADRIYVEALRQAVERACPGAVVRAVHRLAEARAALIEQPVDLLLAGFDFPDGDVLSLLGGSPLERGRGWRHALIVTSRKEERVLALLRAAPIAGVFDSGAEDFSRLVAVMPEVVAGRQYWSASILARLQRLRAAGGTLCGRLTPIELLVFSAVGDGSDDTVAAARIGLEPGYVRNVRNTLHGKLGVQHRGELTRKASESGVVVITADGVHRPGFDSLLASNRAKR